MLLGLLTSNRVVQVIPKEALVESWQPDQVERDTTIYMIVQVQPTFPGGRQAFSRYMDLASKYPVSTTRSKTSKSLTVRLLIEKSGQIADVTILKSDVNQEVEKDAKRILHNTPNWLPGSHNGNLVRVYYILTLYYQ